LGFPAEQSTTGKYGQHGEKFREEVGSLDHHAPTMTVSAAEQNPTRAEQRHCH